MPIPQQRDLESTTERITAWLTSRLPGAEAVTVSGLTMPATGNSNETLLFDAGWVEEGQRREERFVLRVQPAGYQLFLGADVMLQFRMMEALARQGHVPVAGLLGAEHDPEVLGAPFFVMAHVDGRVATEVPSYHKVGWIADLAPSEREVLWRNAMTAFVGVAHTRVDDGFEFLAVDEGLDGYLTWVAEWFDWTLQGRPSPILEAGLEYVLSRRPATVPPVGVVWGDARIGNMILRHDLTVGAVIDWEMAAVGPPEVDLGWWVFFDRFLSEGMGVPRLEGIPGHDDTVAHYEALLGRPVVDLDYYEVLASLRMAVTVLRGASLREERGVLDDAIRFTTGTPVTQILAADLGLPVPDLCDEFRAIVSQREAGEVPAP